MSARRRANVEGGTVQAGAFGSRVPTWVIPANSLAVG
jgi:hypothetical protein